MTWASLSHTAYRDGAVAVGEPLRLEPPAGGDGPPGAWRPTSSKWRDSAPIMPAGTWPRVHVAAGQRLGTGEGRSKKDAEQVAARVACRSLDVERGGGDA